MSDGLEPVLGGAGAPPSGDNANSGNPADNSANRDNLDPHQGFAGAQGNNNLPNGSGDFLSSLSEENRAIAQAKNWSSLDDVVSGYRSAEQRMSQGLQMKPEGENGDLTPEQWDQFGKKVGAPEKADYYQFQRPEIPDYVAYDEDLEGAFKQAAHDVRMTKAQANKFYQTMSNHMIKQQQGGHTQIRESMSRANTMIANEYGGTESPMYKDSVQMAFRSIKSTPGLLEAYQRAGLLIPAGNGKYHVTDASVVFAHANSGSALLNESDGLMDGGGGSANNPFAEGSENLTLQGQIVKKNPREAAALIRQAGKNPADYGITV